MNDLIISCIQTELVWEDKPANLQHIEAWLQQVPSTAHIVVLPEMFATGFSMNAAALAESMDGPTIQWMKDMARQYRKIITGSLIIAEGGRYYNRLIWMLPNGQYYHYDKRHLFGFAGEDQHFSAGKEKTIVQVNGWKICLQICYDLRFPVWARQQAPSAQGIQYDILLYVANWPERRIGAWDTLLKARAIENQCYVVGVNRVGNDKSGIYHNGSSSIIDPWGEVLWNLQHEEGIHTQQLDYAPLQNAREKLPFLKDGDRFMIL
ncbi:MAG TPA: amidohydrolase [Edaphocola sp.]|nr:amidohydrolase [Edaphocola sp.]